MQYLANDKQSTVRSYWSAVFAPPHPSIGVIYGISSEKEKLDARTPAWGNKNSSFLARQIESISLRRRLQVILTRFPHTNADEIHHAKGAYGFILESLAYVSLSWKLVSSSNDWLRSSSCCPTEQKEQITQLLLVQISSRQTIQLLQALGSVPIETTKYFLSEVFSAVSLMWRDLIM